MYTNLKLNKVSILLALLSLCLGVFFIRHPNFIATHKLYEDLEFILSETTLGTILIAIGVSLFLTCLVNNDRLRFIVLVVFVLIFSLIFYTFLFEHILHRDNTMWIWSSFYVLLAFSEIKVRNIK